MNGNETYRLLAEALPYELQSALLSIREVHDDHEANKALFEKMPTPTFVGLVELCLIENPDIWNPQWQLTTAGKHLVEYCTC